MLGRPMLGRCPPMLGRCPPILGLCPPMLGRAAPMLGRPPIDLPPPPPAVEMLNREGLEEAAVVACLLGAKEERDEEAPTPREFRDALDTVASVVRLRAAMFASLSPAVPWQVKNATQNQKYFLSGSEQPQSFFNASEQQQRALSDQNTCRRISLVLSIAGSARAKHGAGAQQLAWGVEVDFVHEVHFLIFCRWAIFIETASEW